MPGTQTVQVQAETQGNVSEGAVSFAARQVSSLLQMAPEPVLFARVRLIMAAGPDWASGAELGSDQGHPAGAGAG